MQLLAVTQHFFPALPSEQGCTVYSTWLTWAIHCWPIRNQHEKKVAMHVGIRQNVQYVGTCIGERHRSKHVWSDHDAAVFQCTVQYICPLLCSTAWSNAESFWETRSEVLQKAGFSWNCTFSISWGNSEILLKKHSFDQSCDCLLISRWVCPVDIVAIRPKLKTCTPETEVR